MSKEVNIREWHGSRMMPGSPFCSLLLLLLFAPSLVVAVQHYRQLMGGCLEVLVKALMTCVADRHVFKFIFSTPDPPVHHTDVLLQVHITGE